MRRELLFFTFYRGVVKLFLLVFIGSFVYCLSMVLLLNTWGGLFQHSEIVTSDFRIERLSNSTNFVWYSYRVKENYYSNEFKVKSDLIKEMEYQDLLIIRYVKICPSISYMKGVKLEIRYLIGMGFSLFLIVVARIGVVISNPEIWEYSNKEL